MSVFGEIIASAVGKQIVGKLAELVIEEGTLQWRFKDDVDDMADKMRDMEAMLHDADEMLRQEGGRRRGESAGRWLTKYKSVAYDVEDVLDELETIELLKKSQPKLKLFFSWNNQLLQRISMPHSLKNVRGKIEKLRKDGEALNLVHHHEPQRQGSRKYETFAGQKSGMVGRNREKDKIISLLLNKKTSVDICIIPIVGLGGLGKTTLAESVWADKAVNVFDVQPWVHVSKDFDLHKIGSAILKSINCGINVDNCSLQFLQDHLEKELSSRIYLIVLDDFWEEDGVKLEKLKQMLQHGRDGSRIILTTRNQSVVDKLSTGVLANQGKICPVHESDHIKLDALSAHDCWEVIRHTAFGPRDDQNGLEEVGRQIAEKCGGIPLVANALGQVMSELKTVEAWEKIRDTDIDLGSRDHKDTLERLMLSYYYMQLDFKMCFTYLAAFPKGFVINSDRLIQQWKALGYIRAEDDGKRCINYLMGMSFIQMSGPPSAFPRPINAKAPTELIVPNLVHDLATVIMGNEIIILNATEPRTIKKGQHHYCRHVQLVNYHNQCKVFEDLPGKIRSLHVRDSGNLQLPKKAFSRSMYIRVLELGGCLVDEQGTPSNTVLPGSTLKLKLLRYLEATGLRIKSLPDSFHTLQNMQSLILSNCSLENLPDSICSLHKLCYLDLSSNTNLSKLPDKFGVLNKLVFLNMSSCSKLAKLPDTVCLVALEHLNLSGCHELEHLPHDFGNLNQLRYLNLSDCYKISMLPESFCELMHLRDLDLSDCHDLGFLPKRMGQLSELESLNLTSCSKLRMLPQSIGTMVKLKYLNLSYCTRLRWLPSSIGDLKLQILDISASSLLDFPDSISKMTTLTHFVVTSGNGRMFRKAQQIKWNIYLPGRTVHRVFKTSTGGGYSSIVELANLTCQELLIGYLENVMKPEDAERVKLRDKSSLRQLVLHWSSNYHMKTGAHEAKSILKRLVPPRTLEQFMIHGYQSKKFPRWMYHISSYLPSLTYLSLSDLGTCDNLPPFGQLPNLRSLYMLRIPSISKIGKEFYGEGGSCTKLRLIQLQSMENLVEWWTTRSGEEDEELLIPNLHNLELKDCPKLKFLPYPPRSIFLLLDNSDEVLPGQGFGRLSSPAIPNSMGIKNCGFSLDKWHRLQHLPTLEDFKLTFCSGLRALPQDIIHFTSLKKLFLGSLKDLETLPEWLGKLTTLQYFGIQNCCGLTSFPESMMYLRSLHLLVLIECEGIGILPECLGHLTSLRELLIVGCPNITSFPERMKNLRSLRLLKLMECKGIQVLPEWLGMLFSLQILYIHDCPNIKSLPNSIRNLNLLKELNISGCPSLVSRCRRAQMPLISHVRNVKLYMEDDREESEEEKEEFIGIKSMEILELEERLTRGLNIGNELSDTECTESDEEPFDIAQFMGSDEETGQSYVTLHNGKSVLEELEMSDCDTSEISDFLRDDEQEEDYMFGAEDDANCRPKIDALHRVDDEEEDYMFRAEDDADYWPEYDAVHWAEDDVERSTEDDVAHSPGDGVVDLPGFYF